LMFSIASSSVAPWTSNQAAQERRRHSLPQNDGVQSSTAWILRKRPLYRRCVQATLETAFAGYPSGLTRQPSTPTGRKPRTAAQAGRCLNGGFPH
jgi:hypothetical protein